MMPDHNKGANAEDLTREAVESSLLSDEALVLEEHPPTRQLEKFKWKYAPVVAVLAIYWLTVAALLFSSARLNQGHLIYPLDDTYIHMAIAKNANLHGTWGVTRYEFTSATSSPLWTSLLAVVDRIGANGGVGAFAIWAPLVLNGVFGSMILIVAWHMLRQSNANVAHNTAALLGLLFFSALPTLTVTGMEHTLHALIMLVFVAVSSHVLASSRRTGMRLTLCLTLLTALLTSARYEGLFAMVVVSMLLAASGKWMPAVMTMLGGLLPPAIYGWWCTLHGWFALPNSVLLKGNTPSFGGRGILQLLVWWHGLYALATNAHLLVLVMASLAVLIVFLSRARWDERAYMNVIFVVVTLLHVEFAATGWFYRYEAYLLIVGLTVLGLTAAEWITPFWRLLRGGIKPAALAAAGLLALFVIMPLAVRAARALAETPRASHNIFEQQYQMGLFLDRYYTGRAVAANDIGAITYLADIKLLDLFGLGSMEVGRLKKAGTYTQAEIFALTAARGVDVAIVYDQWFAQYGGVPPSWHKVGEWGVADNVILGGNVVSFYALPSADTSAIIRDLKEFGPRLPPGVEQRGEYTK